MSLSSGLTGNPATYQSIVIALIAAGILAIGVMSIIYRRRRRLEWERSIRMGLARASTMGDLYSGFPGGAGPPDKPRMWDYTVGGGGEDKEDGEWVPVGVTYHTRPATIPASNSTSSTSTSLSTSKNILGTTSWIGKSNGDTAGSETPEAIPEVQITVMIAMPEAIKSSPAFGSGSGSSTATSTSPRYGSRSDDTRDMEFDLAHLPTLEVDDAVEDLPSMELGTVSVPLRIASAQDRQDIEKWGAAEKQRQVIASDWRAGPNTRVTERPDGTRIVRVDGFRTGPRTGAVYRP